MAINPKSLKNLKPPKKGEVRNPLGINRKRPFTDRIHALSEERLSDTQEGEEIRRILKLAEDATWADASVKRLMRESIKGNVKAFDQMANRVEGRPAQRIDLTGSQVIEQTLKVIFEKRLKSNE